MVGMVVPGTHSPVAAFLGIPTQRQLLEDVPVGPVQVSASMISGTEHEVDLLFLDVGFFPLVTDLITALVIFALTPDHLEMGIGGLVIIAGVTRFILDHISRLGRIERPPHSGQLISLSLTRMTLRA